MPHTLTLEDDLAAVVSPALARLQGMVAAFDPDDRLRWCNATFQQIMGLALNSGPSWTELMRDSHARGTGPVIGAPDFEHWLASTASRRGKVPHRQFEVDLHDGRWFLLTQTVDTRGWILEVGLDVSDLGRSGRELRIARDQALRASQVDALTGIGNRAFALARLAEALARPAPQLPCVALMDLDHFKQVNDQLGHAAGDLVLRHFAQALQASLRRADLCGRIGGEEFLLVLDCADLTQAQEIVERLLAATRAARPLPRRPDFAYSASVGLVRARPGEWPEAVMARADEALYAAKARGRDRCVAVE